MYILYIYTCMYVYLYICIYVYMYMFMYECFFMCLYIYIHKPTWWWPLISIMADISPRNGSGLGPFLGTQELLIKGPCWLRGALQRLPRYMGYIRVLCYR